jgi:hypothetical protein
MGAKLMFNFIYSVNHYELGKILTKFIILPSQPYLWFMLTIKETFGYFSSLNHFSLIRHGLKHVKEPIIVNTLVKKSMSRIANSLIRLPEIINFVPT